MTAYKRVDLAVSAFGTQALRGRRLVVAGDGEERRRLQAQAPDNVDFLGRVDDATLRDLYARCRALVFPGEEDFGIVPVEAMASGAPVIALAAGGVLETVRDGEAGVLFSERTVDGLIDAVRRFEAMADFDPAVVAAHTKAFSTEQFAMRFADFAARATAEFETNGPMVSDSDTLLD